MRSSDNRKTKQTLTQKKKYKHPRCLYSEIEANAYSLKFDLNEIDDNIIKKSDWKKMVKRRILNKFNKESYIKNRTMKKKLRFLQNSKFGEKVYVKRGNLSEISKILLVKLNMLNIVSNYGKLMKCPKCKEDKYLTTERLTCQRRDSRIFTEMDLEETKKEAIL